MHGSMKRMTFVGMLLLLLAAGQAQAANNKSSPTSYRENQSIFLNVKPTPFLALGAGMEIGSYLSEEAAIGINAELDHFLVGGSAFIGLFGRHYFGESVFTQAGFGLSELFFHHSNTRNFGAHVTIGNEWQKESSGLLLGFDWIGFHTQVNANQFGISFPKLRVGWAF